jgi:hypothetical protein
MNAPFYTINWKADTEMNVWRRAKSGKYRRRENVRAGSY